MSKTIALLAAPILLIAVIAIAATPSTQPATLYGGQPQKLRLALATVADTHPMEFLFIIQSMNPEGGQPVAFKTVDSLKKFIMDLPPGSALTWAPGCDRFGQEPLLSSEEAMASFKAFCRERKVELVIIPSG